VIALSKAWKIRIAWLAMLSCLGWLAFAGLDDASLWDDEAMYAVIAKNAASEGRLTTWDGRNLWAMRDAVAVGEDLEMTLNPRPTFWLTAASFRVFGVSTFAARLPFVLAGLLAAVVFGLWVRSELTESRREPLALYSLAALAFSVNFLLFVRNCGYYALVMLFTITTLYFYQRCLATYRIRHCVALATSIALVVLSHYLAGAAVVIALAARFIVFERSHITRATIPKLALVIVLAAAATVPYMVSQRVWYRPDWNGQHVGVLSRLALVGSELVDLNNFNILPYALLAVLVVKQLLRRGDPEVSRKTRATALMLAVYIAILVAVSIHPVGAPPRGELRYFLPVIPLAAFLAGAALFELSRTSRVLSFAVAALLLTTNALSRIPFNAPPRWLLPAYVSEVLHDYPTGTRAAAEYLDEHADRDDWFVAFPESMTYSLQFYVGDKLRTCCMLSTRHRNRRLQERLSSPLLVTNLPRWAIAFGTTETTLGGLQYFQELAARSGEHFELHGVLDVFSGQTQRPELDEHHFGARTDFDHENDGVFIFRRVADDSAAP
jgi:4-amino-4-deoxy-L-arabinose transferase-like glycosyltransferase